MATDPLSRESLSPVQWWGFRLRVPPGYIPKPVSIVDRLAAGLATAVILEIAFLIFSTFWPGRSELFFRGRGPFWLTLLPLLLFLGVPRSLLESSGVAAWMVLAREKGSLAKLDLSLLVACVVALLLAQFRALGSARPALNIALVDAAAAMLFLRMQERITVQWKRWPFRIPDWLRRNLEEEERDKLREEERQGELPSDTIVPPDADAQPIYSLKVALGFSYPVGIRIPDEVLERLRQLNAGARGVLYQSDPQAVVLMDRPPVSDTGRQEILRMCAQILSVARKHQLPTTAFANLVLAFVQQAITYQFDADSTAGFQGGPYEEYGRFAVETLHDQVGDCECTSLFCASLLSYLGFRVALLWVAFDSETVNHVAVGLEVTSGTPADGLDWVPAKDGSDKRYLYGETALHKATSPFGSFPDSKTTLKVERITVLDQPKTKAEAAADLEESEPAPDLAKA